jgi:hypothetical protein
MANNLFYAERPDITTVYFERRDHLNQHTQFLHRSGLVTFRQDAPLPERRHQVAAALARRISWNPQDYEVYESGIAHYIIIFPGPSTETRQFVTIPTSSVTELSLMYTHGSQHSTWSTCRPSFEHG